MVFLFSHRMKAIPAWSVLKATSLELALMWFPWQEKEPAWTLLIHPYIYRERGQNKKKKKTVHVWNKKIHKETKCEFYDWKENMWPSRGNNPQRKRTW